MTRSGAPAQGPTYALLLALIFCAALALRVGTTEVFVGVFSPIDVEANPDQLDYEETAYQLSIGNGYAKEHGEPTARRPPGTSLLILLPYLAFGREPGAARLLLCLLSAVTCLAVAWTTRQIAGPAAAILAAAWLAFYPGHFYYTIHLLSEPPFALFLALACGASFAALRSRSTAWNAAAGVAWALAILTRPQIVLMVPIAWTLLPFLARSSWRSWVRPLAVQTLVLALGLTPWVARNAAVFGKPTLSTVGGNTFWGCNNEQAAPRGWWVPASSLVDELHPWPEGEVEREAASWKYGLDYMRENWRRVPGFVALRLLRLVSPFEPTENRAVFWTFALAWIVTAPFTIGGLLHLWRQRRGEAVVLLLPILGIVAASVIFYGAIRFRDSLAPVFIVPAAIAASRLLERLWPTWRRFAAPTASD